MLRTLLPTAAILTLGLIAAMPDARAQAGHRDPMQSTSPTVPSGVGGNASHGLCPVIQGNEDGPQIGYRRLPPC